MVAYFYYWWHDILYKWVPLEFEALDIKIIKLSIVGVGVGVEKFSAYPNPRLLKFTKLNYRNFVDICIK